MLFLGLMLFQQGVRTSVNLRLCRTMPMELVHRPQPRRTSSEPLPEKPSSGMSACTETNYLQTRTRTGTCIWKTHLTARLDDVYSNWWLRRRPWVSPSLLRPALHRRNRRKQEKLGREWRWTDNEDDVASYIKPQLVKPRVERSGLIEPDHDMMRLSVTLQTTAQLKMRKSVISLYTVAYFGVVVPIKYANWGPSSLQFASDVTLCPSPCTGLGRCGRGFTVPSVGCNEIHFIRVENER